MPAPGGAGHDAGGIAAAPGAAVRHSTFLRAAMGAAASATILQPLDVLKSRQQYFAAKTRQPPPGVWTLAADTVRKEGATALWNGLVPSVIRVSLGVGVQFTVLEQLLRHQRGSGDGHSGAGSGSGNRGGTGGGGPGSATVLWTGGVARAVACAALHPVSVVKVRVETYRDHRYGGPLSALRDIARAEGVAGLYAGLGAALLRDVPYSAFYIFFYQRLLSAAARVQEGGGGSGGGGGVGGVGGSGCGGCDLAGAAESCAGAAPVALPPTVTFSAGLAAGFAATCISHPFDIVKTRLQLDRLPQPASGVVGRLLGVGGVLAHVLRTEGFYGIWRGLPLRLTRRPLQTAITWTVYGMMSGGDGLLGVLTAPKG